LTLPSLFLFAFLPFSLKSQHFSILENGTPHQGGEDIGFLADTPSRKKIDLAGAWNYSIENGPSGTVRIPAAFDFEGDVILERTFSLSPEDVEQYQFSIVCFGVNYSSEVTINGDFIINHVGGYCSFVQQIPENSLQPGDQNHIRVAVSNTLDPLKTIPPRSQVWSWRNYGGILRDVFLLATPKTFVSQVVVQSEVSKTSPAARISVEATVGGIAHELKEEGKKEGPPSVYVEIYDKISGTLVSKNTPLAIVQTGTEDPSVRVEVTLQNPKIWTPASPELYLIKTFVVRMAGKEMRILDQYDLNFGIKNVRMEDGNVLLNGAPYFLKGVIWNEDHPTYGGALTYEEMEKDVVQIKNLGANAIRFAFHPPHPYMLNLCDRYGLFALVELPIVNTPAQLFTQEQFSYVAEALMREMIVRDRHHVSVLAWGVGDDFETSGPSIRGTLEGIVRVARSLDTRPIYYGTRSGNDVCSDLVDFTLWNSHARDIKQFKQELEQWRTLQHGRLHLVGRVGAEVEQGNHNGYSDPLSYEAQARFHLQRLDAIKALGYDGAFLLAFNDWKGDRPSLSVNTGDPWMHSYGLVAYHREKRLGYDAVRSWFRGEKFIALPVGAYTSSIHVVYVLSCLVLLIGAAYFYNVNRRFRENLKRSLMNAFNFFSDVRDQRSVPVIHGVMLGLMVSAILAIVMSSLLHHFRNSLLLDNALTYLLVFDNLKEVMITLIRDPLTLILYGTLFFFCCLLGVTLIISLLSPLVRSRVLGYHAFVITIWSTPPLLLLIPPGMVLYQLLEKPLYASSAIVLVALLLVWVFFRILKGISIIFETAAVRVYTLGILSTGLCVGIMYAYLDYTQSAPMYLNYLYHMLGSWQ
jgi:hypothetical protein